MSTQTVAPQAYRQPTRNELRNQISEESPGINLYRSGDDWLARKVYGITFWFPPDLGGKMIEAPPNHPAGMSGELFKADGVVEIRDVYGMTYEPGDGLQKPPKPLGRGIIHSAADVVEFLVTHYGKYGIVILGSNQARNETAKTQSRKVVYASRKAWAETERAQRQKDIERVKMQPGWKDGSPIPPPTPTQLRAQEWLDANALTQFEASRYKCSCGHWVGNDYTLYRKHSFAAHNLTLPETPEDETPQARLAQTREAQADRDSIAAAMAEAEDEFAEKSAKLEARAKELEAQAKALQAREDAMARLEERLAALEGAGKANGKGKGRKVRKGD